MEVKKYWNESEYHVNGYDYNYKAKREYQDALSVGELYTILGKMLKEGRLQPNEKVVISSNGIAGFAHEFCFSNKGFPLIKDLCG